MNDHQRMLFLILILAFVGTFVAGVTNYLLYNAAFEQNRERLVVTALSQARLIEAIARHEVDAEGEKGLSEAMQLVKEFRSEFDVFGETGEFVLARQERNQIIFLYRQRGNNLEPPKPVPMDSQGAEPMRRALLGQSGTLVGLDYQGETVLAAHEPVAVLNLGVVVKIDLSEIRRPSLRPG